MKKIGLIGGTGPESTLIYYKELCTRVYNATGNFPEIVMESINLTKASKYMMEKDYDSLTDYLGACLNNLVNSGAEIVALTAVTMHAIYDRLKNIVNVPMISIPDTACDYAIKMGFKKIGLLGTIFTMENDYMKKPFINNGIEIVVPNESDRKLVHNRIFNELEAGIVKESTVNELIAIINKMKNEEGIDSIILGCTELPLALNKDSSLLPVLDAMGLHIDKLTDLILK